MPRTARELSSTNVYHIIFRGNDKQDIFYDNKDRYAYLKRLKESKEKFDYEIYAYCLMSNHVHLVIRVKDKLLSKSMHYLGLRYTAYFNKKNNRIGHLFQDRFFSKKVENLDYFINVCKYVHRNPENANIEKTEKYKWSSFNEYLSNKEKVVNKEVLLHYFDNNIEKLKKYTLDNNDKKQLCRSAEFELIRKLSEEEIGDIIKKMFDLECASDISLLEKEKKNKIIRNLREIDGTSIAQLSRVTKVTEYYIKKIWEEK